ncbi:hypothetical protein OF83DRAFT_1084879 [Amylostereum chailletii]|nr:hypothetical protein OF83DRAFT_1084879 [Amylostereum chailletii]
MAPVESGLFSSVIGYISREVQDFVSSATGGSATEASTSRSSRHRTRPGSHVTRSRRRARSEERISREQELSEDDASTSRRLDRPSGGHSSRRRRQTHSEDDDDSSPSPRQRKPASKTIHPRSVLAHPRSPSPTLLSTRKSQVRDPIPAENEEPQAPELSHSASPSPPPLPTRLRALKRRSSITMPGSLFPRSESMEPDDMDDERHARFAPGTASPAPTRFGQGSSSSYVEYTIPLAGSSTSPHPTSSQLASARPPRERTPPAHLDTPTKRSRDIKGKGRAQDTDPSTVPPSSPSNGRYETHNVGFGMLGKEKELLAVRQEHREKESLWEHEADTSGIREERDEYKEKIRLLEEQVQWLKGELAKRPSPASVYPTTNAMPPPPPPPPPLPSFRMRVPTSDIDPESLFAHARASLRHTGTPVEAPINPPALPKRKGQPTVNVPSDKMAAFLDEMKTVRLRKVAGGPVDLSSGTFPRLGEKRKRPTDGQDIQALKRRLTETSLPPPRPKLDLDPFSRSFSGLPASQPIAGPSSLSRSYIPTRGWPSSSVDGTDVTPSLMSDDIDHEGDTSPDDRIPATPPLAPVDDNQLAIADVEEEIPDVYMTSPQKRTSIPRSTTPPRPKLSSLSFEKLLEKRPPKSPLPAPTPVKPRPPARLPRRTPTRPDIYLEDSDEDPLNLPYTNTQSPEPEPAPPKKNHGRSMIPQRTGLQRPPLKFTRVENTSPTRGGSKVPTTKTERRRTLDEELRQAEDSLSEEDFRGFDVEDEVLVGVGSRSKNKGYLAHGGAGGKPVFMGVGYVEGVIDEEEEEEEAVRQSKRKGRAASTRSRR